MNDLFNALGGKPIQSPMQDMMNSFLQFKQNFKGDPKAMFEQMLNSGRINPQQYQQLQTMARQFQQMLGR